MFNFLKDTISPFGYLMPFAGFSFAEGDPPAKWQDSLPDDIKADPLFTKYEKPEDAHRALLSAQKFLGREHLPAPKGADDADAIAMIHKALGLPENGEGYQLPTDLEIPKELPLNEDMIKDFRNVAHGLGISPKQFAGVYKWYMNSTIGEFNKFNDESAKEADEARVALRKEWGAAYKQNEALAYKVFKQFADNDT